MKRGTTGYTVRGYIRGPMLRGVFEIERAKNHRSCLILLGEGTTGNFKEVFHAI